jgi:diadenylate cyclase
VGLVGLQSFLGYIAPFTAIALVVLFQGEIRRSLTQLGRRHFFGTSRPEDALEDILPAMKLLSESRTGALITLEHTVGLRTFIESGVRMDAQVSSALLVSIFQRNSPLHDGAVIIQKGTIAAAACFLPLTTRPVAGVKAGSRHRAAIGITEDTDCISIIVSEENGELSVATDGTLSGPLDLERVRERVSAHLGGKGRSAEGLR